MIRQLDLLPSELPDEPTHILEAVGRLMERTALVLRPLSHEDRVLAVCHLLALVYAAGVKGDT